MAENVPHPDTEESQPVLLTDVTVRCRHCGYQGPAEPRAPGKMWLEAVMWIAFVVPGVIYSMWRLFGRKYLCPQCKAADGEVTVPVGRKVAMVLRALFLLLFLVVMGFLAVIWNLPRSG